MVQPEIHVPGDACRSNKNVFVFQFRAFLSPFKWVKFHVEEGKMALEFQLKFWVELPFWA